jgi:hypothetical protein
LIGDIGENRVEAESLQGVWTDLKFLILEDTGMSVETLKLRFNGTDLQFDQLFDSEKIGLSCQIQNRGY